MEYLKAARLYMDGAEYDASLERAVVLSHEKASEYDAHILAAAKLRWQKVAMILTKVCVPGKEIPADGLLDVVAARIVTLVNDGQLEAQGDLANWRFSEVRLPPQPIQD